MKAGESYPSKVMLVGEYGVVLGGSALTIPFTRFTATVRDTAGISPKTREEAERSRHYLSNLFGYISGIPGSGFHAKPDIDRFSESLGDYWLEMNIPSGYGLGSSGAVSAAVYELFFPGARELTLREQKEDLARIESFFHGKSSGVDALTCFCRCPLHFAGDGSVRKVAFRPGSVPGGYRFFLLDSKVRFETGPLVNHFLHMLKDPHYADSIRKEYLEINRKLIETLLGDRKADPGLLFRTLSDYQFKHFRKMIPEEMADAWIEGQVSNDYYLKLNGSGGGYMLGITHRNSGESLDSRWNKQIVWID